ncbi:MAG: hypothetical protein QME94_09390, partial [Anaerolineae bacterium]|nr:hypothetical protein [Anaerolineae bacterium]
MGLSSLRITGRGPRVATLLLTAGTLAVVTVDAALIVHAGLPLVSLALAGLLAGLFLSCRPASLVMGVILVNAFINAFSRSVSIAVGPVSLNPSELLGLMIIALGTLALLRRPVPMAGLGPILLLLVAGNAILVVSSIRAGRLGPENLAHLTRNLTFLVLLLLAVSSFREEKQVRQAVGLFSWASLVPIGVGIRQALAGTGNRSLLPGELDRIYGTWHHPNPYSFYLLLVLALSLSTLLDARRRRERLLSALWCALVLTCLFLTYTRIAWAGLAVVVLVVSVARRNPWPAAALALLA